MKGIILAGGTGTRLRPLTKIVSKQLLHVYNRPLIYYPLNTLLRAGIKEILVIVTPESSGQFVNLLGSGRDFGIKISYEVQEEPRGLADAFIIGAKFIGGGNVAMILGDNIFEGYLGDKIRNFESGARIFAKRVPDPQRFGIVEFGSNGKAISIEEKPEKPKSDYCITGLYLYDGKVSKIARKIKPSKRGELEIVDIHNWYLEQGELEVVRLEKEWIDTGTFDSLFDAQVLAKEKISKPEYWHASLR